MVAVRINTYRRRSTLTTCRNDTALGPASISTARIGGSTFPGNWR
jgi:hypothetical protein